MRVDRHDGERSARAAARFACKGAHAFFALLLLAAAPRPVAAQQCHACQCAGSDETHPVTSQEDCWRGCNAWGIICATERYLFAPDYIRRFGHMKLRVPGGGNFSPFHVSSCPDGIYFGAGTLIGPDHCPWVR